MDIFKRKSPRSSSRNGSRGGDGRRQSPARRLWAKDSNRDPERAAQDPFADSSETDTREEETLAAPLPVANLVSKYNRSFGASQKSLESQSPSQSQRYSWPKRLSTHEEQLGEDIDALELRIRSLEQIREEYYQPSPEQSDDSGPMLPIMTPEEKRASKGQIRVSIPLRSANRTPKQGH